MGMTLQRRQGARTACFDRERNPCASDSPNLGEARTYYEPSMFVPVASVIYPGHEQPWHRHEQTVEWVIVLEGEIAFLEGEVKVIAQAGDAVLFTPSPSKFHTMRNESAHPARYLTVKAPIHPVPMDVMTADRIEPDGEGS